MAAGTSDGSSDAASLALRIATVASTAMMASASQRSSCAGCAQASQVSYSDYSSLKYYLVANIVSAALQAAACGREGEGKAAKSLAELVTTQV